MWQEVQTVPSLPKVCMDRIRRVLSRASVVVFWLYLLALPVICGPITGFVGLVYAVYGQDTRSVEGGNIPPPPAPLAFALEAIPKPSGVKNWSHPRFSPNGEFLAFHFSGEESAESFRIGRIRPDGTAFECLTCKFQLDARRPVWFPDGKRIMFHTPQGITNVFYVLELEQGKIYEIKGMRSGHLFDHNRVAIISDDAAKLIWTKVWRDGFRIVMGNLVKNQYGYSVQDVHLIYPPSVTDKSNTAQWEQALAWYESKHLTDGGKTLVFAASRDQGANLDAYLLDLATGAVRRLTNHLEWDEGGEFSPDGWLFAFETTRAHEVLSVLANVPIPPFLDFALVLPIRNVTLTGAWFAPHEPFVIDKFGDRGEYMGQRLSAAGDQGWALRGGVHWHRDGTQITWSEWLSPDQVDGRILVGKFSDLTPGEPLSQVHTPTPTWAPLLKDVPTRPVRVYKKLPGKVSGTALLDYRGGLVKGKFKVSFEDYSADGERVLNGFMAVDVKRLGAARIRSDIQLSGMHSGFVKGDLSIVGKEISGTVVSERDGTRFEKSF
jgi:hypothetical protein